MLWNFLKTHPRIGFGIFLLVSVFVSFYFSCLNTTSVSALSDISVTFDSSSPSTSLGQQIFYSNNLDDSTFFQYSYLNITFSPHRSFSSSIGSSYLQPIFYFRMICTNAYVASSYFNSSYQIWSPSPGASCRDNTFVPKFTSVVNWSTLLSSGESVTFTLSESSIFSSDCPVCEECQVCPAIPDNPYDDKFDRIIVAIYTVGGILLVIYFFYGIYRMIIRSSKGGN